MLDRFHYCTDFCVCGIRAATRSRCVGEVLADFAEFWLDYYEYNMNIIFHPCLSLLLTSLFSLA
jgi:hypothetical protein